jgi:hypothetical protein
MESPATTAEADVLGARFGVPPKTSVPAGPVAAMTPLPEVPAEVRDESKGFLNNLTARDLLNAPRHGAAAGAIKYLTGNTDAEQTRRRRAMGQDTDPIEREFNTAIEAAYQAGGYDAPDYQQLDKAFAQYRTARDNPEFRWKDLQAAIADDPGGFSAEFVKSVAADPELLPLRLVPWQRLPALPDLW